jgi:prophage maintenance system killer protein
MQLLENPYGTIVLYQAPDGKTALDVQLQDETVWLTQAQMAELFQAERSVITKHINNIFRSEELVKEAVCANFAHTAADGKSYRVNFYSLDVIIAVGYRVNAKRGTQFRIWASSILKDYLVRGYAVNQRRLAEKGLSELRGMLDLLSATLEQHQLVDATGQAVLQLVRHYGQTWNLLLQYDEERLDFSPKKARQTEGASSFDLAQVRAAIACLKDDLAVKGETSGLFGQEREEILAGILGAIHQTFDGQELYPSLEEKAAHLLYFVIKDHPFNDGNKRIGSFLFLLYLQQQGLGEQSLFDNKAIVALALLVASSAPRHKELIVRLIAHLLYEEQDGAA